MADKFLKEAAEISARTAKTLDRYIVELQIEKEKKEAIKHEGFGARGRGTRATCV